MDWVDECLRLCDLVRKTVVNSSSFTQNKPFDNEKIKKVALLQPQTKNCVSVMCFLNEPILII